MGRPPAPLLLVEPERPDPRKVGQVVDVLRSGGVIGYPTDTVYAIGASAAVRRAVDRVYRVKNLDRGHPLAFVLADVASVGRYATVTDFAYRWLRRLLPGPFTVVLDATPEVPRILLEKRRTVGIRVPDHAWLQAVVRELGAPLVGTSAANPEDGAVYQDAAEIRERLGAEVDLVLDGGLLGTTPSTVVSLVGDEIELIRQGKGELPT